MTAIVMWLFFSLAGALLLVAWVVHRNKAKRRAAHEAEIRAESERLARAKAAEPFVPGRAPYIRTSRTERRSSSRYVAPAPTVVYRDTNNGMDPLMAGAIGYMIGSSGSDHHHRDEPAPFQAGGGDMGGGGASSSWDGGSSSDSSSSSSDSGSSSSDSGSSSSGSSSD